MHLLSVFSNNLDKKYQEQKRCCHNSGQSKGFSFLVRKFPSLKQRLWSLKITDRLSLKEKLTCDGSP
jgi:hypothetical protein